MKKHKTRTYSLLSLFILCLLLSFSACGSGFSDIKGSLNSFYSDDNTPAPPTPTPTFEEFSSELFLGEITCDTISLHYSISDPEAYGITEVPITLGEFSVEENPDDADYTSDLYEMLVSYPYDELTKEEQMTYDSLHRVLELSLSDSASPYLNELLGPTTGFQAQLPLLLAEYRFNTREDIDNYIALLPCVYEYFEQIAQFEREKSAEGLFMNDNTANEIISQCLDFAENPDDNFLLSSFEERLDAFPDLSLSDKTVYIMQNRTALMTYIIPAYELLADTLTELLGTGTNAYGLCYYEGGKDYYALSVKQETGSDKTIDELRDLLKTTIDQNFMDISTALVTDASIYDEYRSFSFPETDPNEIMSYLITACAEDFPALDHPGYTIKYIPESLQEHVSPAMYLIPPIDAYTTNSIYINQNPEYDMSVIFPTIAHEGYPGHLYQNVYTLSNGITPLRYLLGTTGYSEGWATYVETYSYNYAGCSESLASFMQTDQITTLCLYALSDIYIHYDGYTPEQVAKFLFSYGFSNTIASSIYETLLEEPVVYLPYAVGYLEFVSLKEAAMEQWGDDYSDYRFHEFIMETGPLPFSVLNSRLMAE